MLPFKKEKESFQHGEDGDMNKFKTTSYPNQSKMSYRIPNFLDGISAGFDSGLLPHSNAVFSYNFDFSGGALKAGVGFKRGLIDLFDESKREDVQAQLEGIGSIVRVFLYRAYDHDAESRSDKILLLNTDLVLFILDLDGEHAISRVRDITFSSIPKAISYRLGGKDVLILASETDNLVVYDGENYPYEVLDAPKISSMDIHFERLFVTTTNEKARVLFSDDLDPTNWSIDLSEAGFIEMVDERGALNRVVSFNDYLYVFRDYGISRLTAFGDQEGFSVSHLFVSSAKIYPETVTVCGDQILFLASNGLYSFNGYTTTKILSELSAMFASANDCAHGAYFCGKYYLSLNMKFDKRAEFDESGFSCNCLLEYDLKQKKYQLTRGVDVVHIQPICVAGVEKLYLCARVISSEKYMVVELDRSGSFLGEPLVKVWRTDYFGFGKNQRNKVLRNFSATIAGSVQLKVLSDSGDSKTYDLESGNVSVNMLLFGSKFAFEFVSKSADAKVLSPELVIMAGGGV